MLKQIAVSAPAPIGSPSKDSGLGLDHETHCHNRVRLMYRFWRKTDVFDPEVFSAGATAVLSEYSADIVDFVTDPRTGLPSKSEWPPSIKEIRDACESLAQRQRDQEHREHARQEQERRRRRDIEQEAERGNRPTLDELRAQGLLRPEPPVVPVAPEQLWAKWCEHRQWRGARLAPESRSILEQAGYVIDGPDGQSPKEAA